MKQYWYQGWAAPVAGSSDYWEYTDSYSNRNELILTSSDAELFSVSDSLKTKILPLDLYQENYFKSEWSRKWVESIYNYRLHSLLK